MRLGKKKIPFTFVCPFCEQSSVMTQESYYQLLSRYDNSYGRQLGVGLSDSSNKPAGYALYVMKCLNENCLRLTVEVATGQIVTSQDGYSITGIASATLHKILPRSSARQLPEYIPLQLRDDYEEACLIATLSPKGAAALARRCLQGMIKDFFSPNSHNIGAMINEIRSIVGDEIADAIRAVPTIGDVAAHPEKDINAIVGVEEGEALQIIGLLELLFDEWYITRHERQGRLAAASALSRKKTSERRSAVRDTKKVNQPLSE